jgi:hypothetical protein
MTPVITTRMIAFEAKLGLEIRADECAVRTGGGPDSRELTAESPLIGSDEA